MFLGRGLILLRIFWSQILFCVDVDQFFISVVRWSLVVFVLGDGSRAMARMSYGASFFQARVGVVCGCIHWSPVDSEYRL